MNHMSQKSPPQIVVSGMRPTGKLHLGHYFGVLHNWTTLQQNYQCYFFVANWHSLTTEYAQVAIIRESQKEMMLDWLASGVDPQKACLFVQSHVPEHAELHVLLSMITPVSWLERVPTYKELQQELKDKDLSTYGFLGYPLLQTADVAIYKANWVPVGQDQVAHIELSREVLRRFNYLYGDTFPEPQPLLTQSPKLPGTDGRKMSKSYQNSIYLSDSVSDMNAKIKTCMTDPARMRRADPGNPEVCPVFDYHKQVTSSQDLAQIDADCRVAGIGCVDCKKKLMGNLENALAPFREKRQTLQADPGLIDQVMQEGARFARTKAQANLAQVLEKMGLS